MKKLIFIMTIAAISLSSCLKDSATTVNFSKAGNIVNFPLSGLANFGGDAITTDIDTVMFAVDYATAASNKALSVTIAVDQTLTTAYNAANPAITYLPMPTADYSLSATTVTIPAGAQYTFITLIVQKALLDPSQSYMLPVKIASASGVAISANQSVHYYHVIGNDFAGVYTYDYRRYQNGTGPGAGKIPSNPANAGTPPDISSLGNSVTISPVSPTEIQMTTDYNGQGVNYDVTFTRTVSGSSVTYTNWAVTFLPGDIAKWTAAGIANIVPPAFTVAPPANNTSAKFFELNYVSGGAHGRYIDDTYHK